MRLYAWFANLSKINLLMVFLRRMAGDKKTDSCGMSPFRTAVAGCRVVS